MKKLLSICLFLFLLSLCSANVAPLPGKEPKLNIHNIVLTKVNGKSISVIDVMKKMDFIFHKAYPNLISSKQARYQFYSSSWKHVLTELINTELMLAQAEAKEIKIHDSEIREEMENRFGPNTMTNLSTVGLSYNEAFQMIKTELIVRRMMWFFVQSKALTQITPQLIKQEYRLYLEKNPSFDEWDYQVISVKGSNDQEAEAAANKIYELTKSNTLSFEELEAKLKELEKEFVNTNMQASPTYKVTSKDISKSHKDVLSTLQVNSFSPPIFQTSRSDNKKIHRIFFLKRHELKTPPSFEEMADNIKNELLQKAVSEESELYFAKLRKYYGITQESAIIPENFEPFSIE